VEGRNKGSDSCEGNPKQPFVAILAGAKYDTKIEPLKANVQESAQG
jgi:3-phosphoglycerate kinase